jgi:ubiquinone/menaquinone biosynthesis C-methylase UbiE
MSDVIAAAKAGQRRVWSAGSYPAIAEIIASVGELSVQRAGVQAGDDVLDVAAGDGNVSIPAARAGAKVTALDLTPELFESGRARAAAAGVEIEWVEGDAEDLPYDDASFDRVLSNFGAMFAPRHAVAAAQLVRVCKPGGTVLMTTWSKEGFNGRLFGTIGRYMPSPPPGIEGPTSWGDEDHVREMFGAAGVDVEIARHTVLTQGDSVDAFMARFLPRFGPLVVARPMLEEQGTWDALLADYRQMLEDANTATDGTLRYDAEYLVVTATP